MNMRRSNILNWQSRTSFAIGTPAVRWLSASRVVLRGFVRSSRWFGFGRGHQLGKLLAEDLVHDFCASGECWHDLVPVDQLGRGGLIVSREQRDCFHRHAMRGQQRYERVP